MSLPFIKSRYDANAGVCYWYFSSMSAAPPFTLDKWVAWHIESNGWTKGDLLVADPISGNDPTPAQLPNPLVITLDNALKSYSGKPTPDTAWKVPSCHWPTVQYLLSF